MEFGILGPLEIFRGDGSAVAISQNRQRAVLSMLLLHCGEPLSPAWLSEALWEDRQPRNPKGALISCIYSLRKDLGLYSRLRTHPAGYTIELEDDDVLDVRTFCEQSSQGRQAFAEHDHAAAAALLEQALGLWREPPLADFPATTVVEAELSALAEQRRIAEEILIDAKLARGGHDDLIPGLQARTALEPLRERLADRLMLALYRAGRQAEALSVYQTARRALIDQLGIEPGRELRQLHQRILAADPLLDLAAPASGPVLVLRADKPAPGGPAGAAHGLPAAVRAVPAELPADVANFVGRSDELDLLGARLAEDSNRPAAALVVVVDGCAGIGKTALAVRWARQVAGKFPDGQFFIDLRGICAEEPTTAAKALGQLLRSMGQPAGQIPDEEEDRVARYRSLLSGKRVLVFLDNASSVEQVSTLLPVEPGCMALVTSRVTLTGLTALNDAYQLTLDPVPHNDAVALLARLLGTARIANEQELAGELARLCGWLPLALRAAAGHLLVRAEPIGVYVNELAADRLAMLAVPGDPRGDVRRSFSHSYRALDEESRRLFRRIGLLDGTQFSSNVAAALLDISVAQGEELLNRLAAAHLVKRLAPDRFRMPELLHDFAAHLAQREEGEHGMGATTVSPDRRLRSTSTLKLAVPAVPA